LDDSTTGQEESNKKCFPVRTPSILHGELEAMFTPAPVMTLQVASKWISRKSQQKHHLELKGFWIITKHCLP
jgi:hypothetical protein